MCEIPDVCKFVSVDVSANYYENTAHDIPSTPSAPPRPDDVGPEPGDHTIPKDSTLSDVSEGPPRYRALFPPDHVPIVTDEGLPPPPTYEESQQMNDNLI